MKDVILIGRQEQILEVSAEDWRKHLAFTQQHGSTRLNFMTSDHHRIRNFVVAALPRNNGNPLSVQDIAQQLCFPLSTISDLLDDLERHLFFLVRNAAGEVSWAFPVTSEKTVHRLNFSSGERIFGA